jgi:hypothetical protein
MEGSAVQLRVLQALCTWSIIQCATLIVYGQAKNAPTYKRDQKKPYAHPYYWAPVILIGNLR